MWADTVYPSEKHWVPMGDLREHEICGSCWCKPKRRNRWYEGEELYFMWYHNALDNREFYTKGLIYLQ